MPLTHDYFTQEMGGRLEVETDHDAITITLQGRASEYDRIVDYLRAALVTTPLSPENLVKVREARLKGLSAPKPSAADVADRAIAERLFGSFPYANPVGGTAESLARIERADLMLAREKFLNPNNATLVIIGGVDQPPRYAGPEATARRLAQERSNGTRNFPSARSNPDPRILIANSPETKMAEVRLAVRGLARSDRDYFAAILLAAIARDRWQKLLPDLKGSFFVNQDAHVLPGMFLMGASVDGAAAARTMEGARNVLKSLVDSPVLPTELDKAKGEALALMNHKLSQNDTLAEAWLDIDTYSLPSLSELMRAWNAISASDLQRVAARLFSETAIASVVVGNAEQLKTQLAATSKIEMLGEAKPKAPEQQPTTTTTTTQPNRRPVPILPPPKEPKPALEEHQARNQA